MPKKKKKANQRRHVPIELPIHRKLVKLADDNGRTISGQMAHLIDAAYEKGKA